MDPKDVFEKNYDALCRYLLRFTGDADAAADAAQEAFVRMLDRMPQTVSHPRAWLFTVATNMAMEVARTRTRRRRILEREGSRAPHADPLPAADDEVEAEVRRRRVRQALLTLSAKERQALLMREEGFAQHEIAEAVGTTTGSVGTLIARAMIKLARVLEPDRENL